MLCVLFSSCVAFAKTSNDDAIAERYWRIVASSPRWGTSFDRLYEHYEKQDQVDLLIEKANALMLALRDLPPLWPQTAPLEMEDRRFALSRAVLLLGMIYERRGEIKTAADGYFMACLFGGGTLPCQYYGQACLQLGSTGDAILYLQAALDLNPLPSDVPELLESLAAAYRKMDDMKKAGETLDRLENLFPGDPDVPLQQAETLLHEGFHEAAWQRFERAHRLAPQRRDILNAWAEAVIRGKNSTISKEQQTSLQSAFKLLEPQNSVDEVRIFRTLSQLAEKAGHFSVAAAHQEKLVASKALTAQNLQAELDRLFFLYGKAGKREKMPACSAIASCRQGTKSFNSESLMP